MVTHRAQCVGIRLLLHNRAGTFASIYIYIYIYIYLEPACHDKLINLQARITKLWRFKAQNMEKLHIEDLLAIFKPGLWQMGFSNVTKNGTIFSSN